MPVVLKTRRGVDRLMRDGPNGPMRTVGADPVRFENLEPDQFAFDQELEVVSSEDPKEEAPKRAGKRGR